MSYIPYKTGSLLIPSGPSDHLFVVMNNACADNMHLLLPVSSIKPNKWHDGTCILGAGCHPFIVKDSFAHYRHMINRKAGHIAKCVADKTFEEKPPMGSAEFLQMFAGIWHSPHSAKWAIQYADHIVQCGL